MRLWHAVYTLRDLRGPLRGICAAKYIICRAVPRPRTPRLPRRPPRRQYTAAGSRSGHKHRSTAKGMVGLGVVEFYGRSRSDLCGSRSFMLPNRRFYGSVRAKITRPSTLYTRLFPQIPQGCGKHSLIKKRLFFFKKPYIYLNNQGDYKNYQTL